MFFGLFNILFTIAFVAVAVVIIVTAIRSLGQWAENNNSPRLTVPATVVAKRTNVDHHNGNDAAQYHSSTTYYATFQVASGDRMELHVGGREYGMLAEGDFGELTFQGTRYLGFARQGVAETTPTEETEGKTATDDGKHRSWDPEL